MNELALDRTLKRGSRGKRVRQVQEWLGLHGTGLAIDGDFGPATEREVRRFQKRKRISQTGTVDAGTYSRLVEPMSRALRPLERGAAKPGSRVVAGAKQHLREHPREIGGQNRGPWVRLYMDGNEGEDWPWCAGFVSFIMRQAHDSLGLPVPLRSTVSCDYLATTAMEKERFISERDVRAGARIPPGSIFLCRRTPTDWTHTGIVLRADEEVFETIEGNTNDDGVREGYEVCQRVRGYAKKDFIRI